MQISRSIPIAKPIIEQEEINEVIKVLESGELSSGRWVERFEEDFANLIGTKFAVAVSNGTTALYLSLLALGIKKGDEVMTTPFTFIASSNAILYTGAKVVFVDIDSKTFNINPDLIEEKITTKTRAILPVHLFGLPADMQKILKIAKKHNIYVIEDAAQAHGAKIGNKSAGSFGDLSAFSFYPTKNMTTGEGGMITANDENLVRKIKKLRNQGMEKRYYHDILGFNFRMTNIQAAIGIHQLKKLDNFNKRRIKNAKFLSEHLSGIDGIQIPFIPLGLTHVFHQYTILVKDGKEKREKLMEYLKQKSIGTAIYYPLPVHKQKFVKDIIRDVKLPNAEKTSDQVLSLPIHPSVKKQDLKKIINQIKNYYKHL